MYNVMELWDEERGGGPIGKRWIRCVVISERDCNDQPQRWCSEIRGEGCEWLNLRHGIRYEAIFFIGDRGKARREMGSGYGSQAKVRDPGSWVWGLFDDLERGRIGTNAESGVRREVQAGEISER